MEQQDLPIGRPHDAEEQFTLDYPQAELVFGLVYAVGTDYHPVLSFLQDEIALSGYRPNPMHVSEWFPETAEKLRLGLKFPEVPEYDRIDSRIKAGNAIRTATKRAD